ncbi:ABC transporter ATP-binding protein [Halorussus halobius]|uniref:ABC transporter ATP-binding protein n=1 Tax=Halorussus halobius TaxID=1710537 RepID=UPI001092A398|nr:ABC transporter ATP-binding protein [Halorussus halobius]
MSSQLTPRTDGPTDDRALVEVERVSHSFDDLDVLGDVTFSIETGSVACIVGPNGSGKTTLLRLVAGLLDPDDGSVSVAGGPGRRVGYLAQQPAFRGQFTVRETVEFYGALVEPSPDVDAVLDRVGLTAVADRRVDALSGGMRRLLGIAQTMVGEPSVFALDEPSSGLDPAMGRHIRAVIDDLAGGGGAVVLSTHDLRAVERVADTVLLLDHGELVAAGTPEELLAQADAERLEAAIEALGPDAGAASVASGLRGGGR